MYRALNSKMIHSTLERLSKRIEERFPASGLRKVCAELLLLSSECDQKAAQIARPNYALRVLTAFVTLAGIVLFVTAATHIPLKEGSGTLLDVLQGIDAGFNILILMGAFSLFMMTVEGRLKRRRALADLDDLRSVIHVVDMHQLTKDPASTTGLIVATASSPKRTLTPFELIRYLDYCSEMLSLSAKLAALYAQSSKDPVVVDAASDLQQLTANLSAKIWQKINIAQARLP